MRVGWAWLAGASAACAVACSDESMGFGGSFGGGADAGFSGGFGAGGAISTGGTGGFGAIPNTPCESSAECPNGAFCSASRLCTVSGSCLADADCILSPGTFCSITQSCISVGSCVLVEDCDSGEICQQGTCVSAPCAPVEIPLEPVQPNMMFLLNRSCSMLDDFAGEPKPVLENKWSYAVQAVAQLTLDYGSRLRWGLLLFPDAETPDCEQAAPAVPVGQGDERTVWRVLANALNTLDPSYPGSLCVTNIDSAVERASMDPAFADSTRESFAVLITDSQQAGCNAAGGDAGAEQIVADMYAAGIATFVVGLTGETGLDPAKLDALAAAGGTARPAAEQKYYEAADAQQLEQALEAIVATTVGCSFALSSQPTNPDAIYVYLDDQFVAGSPTSWQYDAATNQIRFSGAACEALRQGWATDIDVVFDCRLPTPT